MTHTQMYGYTHKTVLQLAYTQRSNVAHVRMSHATHTQVACSAPTYPVYCGVLQRVAACCSVLQCVAKCCSVLQIAYSAPTYPQLAFQPVMQHTRRLNLPTFQQLAHQRVM